MGEYDTLCDFDPQRKISTVLSQDLKEQIQDAYSTLLKNKNHKPRYGQRVMIADIARTLGNITPSNPELPHLCTIEAGTGTGKTIAYCIAALPIAKKLKKRLIISTATIALQEQILLKDLPDILNQSPLEFTFTLAKGRRRYVCLAMLKKFIQHMNSGENTQQLIDFSEPEFTLSNKEDWALYRKFDEQLQNKKWNGEREDWPDEIEHSSWYAVTADHYQCTGRRCSQYSQCIFYRARERVFKSDCIVVNHDLVLSDLAMGGGTILPAPADSIYIFDEGHHLPDKALNHFSNSAHIHSTGKWMEQLSNHLQQLLDEKSLPISVKQQIEKLPEMAKEGQDYLNALYDLLKNNIQFLEKANSEKLNTHRFLDGIFPNEFHSPVQALEKIFKQAYQSIEKITAFINEVVDEKRTEIPKDLAESWAQQLSPALIRLESGVALWQRYLLEDCKKRPPMARWLNQHQGDDKDIEVCCSPILPANELRYLLWQECYGAVLTSATLAPGGNFELFKLNSGVDGFFNCVPSPFDYQKLVQFYIPPMQSDPSQDVQDHTDEVAELLQQVIDEKQATLVLFSSKKQLNDIEYQLLKQGSKWKNLILTQGRKNKQEIILQHKKTIDKGLGSVIFGLASFAEGVDLPGEYCQHVIITKLPFAVPDNPVEETLSEWLRSKGRNPFFELAVPQTCLKLIQACGRLVRKESDQGKITLLDRRVINKSYGKTILGALPPYQFYFDEMPNQAEKE